jgi:biopolymer transport protein ExbD
MSLPSFIKNKPPSQTASEIELDLTPMMSMFLILLPFLVSMAVLTHLTILEFSLPPNIGQSTGPSNGEKPKIKLTIVITQYYLLVTHGEKMLDSLPLVNGEYDFEKIPSVLELYKKQFDLDDGLVVASRDHVRLKSIVALMDQCRMAGFIKVGLSSATENPSEGK